MNVKSTPEILGWGIRQLLAGVTYPTPQVLAEMKSHNLSRDFEQEHCFWWKILLQLLLELNSREQRLLAAPAILASIARSSSCRFSA